jgi:hypothetical protein
MRNQATYYFRSLPACLGRINELCCRGCEDAVMDMLLGNSLSFESQEGLAHSPFVLLRHRVQARKQAARLSFISPVSETFDEQIYASGIKI